MALGSQAQRFGMILLAAAALAPALPVELNAVEKRLGRDRPGKLRFSVEGLAFSPLKGAARQWSFSQIQRLELTSEGELYMTLYRDVWWKGERDERLHFITTGLADPAALSETLNAQLGERFIPRLPLVRGAEIWRAGAKLLRGWGGPEGDFVLSSDGWRFVSPERGQSITTEDRLTAGISSSGDLQLSVATHGGARQYEFQLKVPLPRDVYDAWWLRLNRPRGLDLIQLEKEPSR